jgi:rhamnose utilization protein RhaD (predicted bifunctional aldolase and dehydrogenase)
MSPEAPDELRKFSRKIGETASLVQGPGGNTSLKDDSSVWVKASGTWLARAESENIFCRVLPASPKIDLNHDSGLRPSIEAHFHTLLPMKAIFHVHSLGSLTWAVRECGEATLREEIPELLWVRYQKPGIELARDLAKKDTSKSIGAILQNHGMVVWADNLADCYLRLIEIEEKLLGLAMEFKGGRKNFTITLEKLKKGPFLTPDHAVFSGNDSKNTPSWELEALEVLQAAIQMIPDSCRITELSPSAVQELVNWDEETYRKKMND